MQRRSYLGWLAGGTTLGLAGCAEMIDPHADPGPEGEEYDRRVAVALYGEFMFSPNTVEIEAGETVLWDWEAGDHDVTPVDIPDDSDWSGTSPDRTYGEGHTYSYTFEVPGEYEYVCSHHEEYGMAGTIIVE